MAERGPLSRRATRGDLPHKGGGDVQPMHTDESKILLARGSSHRLRPVIRHVVLRVGFQPPAVIIHESRIVALSEKGG